MRKLCERPGCSEPASVAYGMRPEDLVFWLDRLPTVPSDSAGVLCQRHADSMIVPRNWTLDDLRDPELHLFRPPVISESSRRRARRHAPTTEAVVEQLALGVDIATAAESSVVHDDEDRTDAERADAHDQDDDEGGSRADDTEDDGADARGEDAPEDAPDDAPDDGDGDGAGDGAGDGDGDPRDDDAATPPEPWSPTFDSDDDLGGLLSARSPLLARAFRGDDRPRR